MDEEKDLTPQDSEEEFVEEKNKNGKLVLIFIVCFVAVFCAVYFGIQAYLSHMAGPETTTVTTTQAPSVQTVIENPVDFASLIEGNDEIYAYIVIDDTNVNYPIVQSGVDDEFYLHRAAEDKSYLPQGAIFTESCNHKNFSDPVTLIYGHNNYGDTMFTTLHYFEDSDFFDSHPYFYIYTPERRLTYQVISAFKYDDRHIMNYNKNFTDLTLVDDFQAEVLNPGSAVKNVREELDVPIDRHSKIVVLSTCVTNQKNNRYLVCGVLTKDEKTD